MKYLESVKLVQFFLFDKQEIRLQEITGVFGPNASGKSSVIDAVQIAMFGANANLISLNAQADERASTRNIRSYCLGMHDETKRVRDNATTYITLTWRDYNTKEPITMGVCIYASIDNDTIEVRGRYILRGVELSMQDHLEVIDNHEHPRPWETFRSQLIERSKMTGEDPLFTDTERYMKDALLKLRGTNGTPSFESFKSAFRFGLRMRFDKPVDKIVRNDVLEARPTNINKFKEITESFRRLNQKVKEVEAKIADAKEVETEFYKATHAFKRAVTWKVLSNYALREESGNLLSNAHDSMLEADENLEKLKTDSNSSNEKLNKAKAQLELHRDLVMSHAAHKDNEGISSDINKYQSDENKKAQEVLSSLNLIRNTLNEASKSEHLSKNASTLLSDAKTIEAALPNYLQLSKEHLSALLKPTIKDAAMAAQELFVEGRSVASQKAQIDDELKLNEDAMLRVKSGRARLSQDTERLLAELKDNGIHATPVCDLVNITDAEWQPVIEAYLGRNVEALLVDKEHEAKAFSVYRGLTGPRAIYGAKIVASSKQLAMEVLHGSIAELITGENEAAVAYLRRRFGDMMRATTDEEALAGKRTLTQDGMIIQSGEYDRIRPALLSNLKVGGGDDNQKAKLAKEIADLKSANEKLEAQIIRIDGLMTSLRRMTDDTALNYILEACEQMHSARSRVSSLQATLEQSADAEYVRLNKLLGEFAEDIKTIEPIAADLERQIGGAEKTLEQCILGEAEAKAKWETAQTAVIESESNSECDRDFASKQWDILLNKFEDNFTSMKMSCIEQMNSSYKDSEKFSGNGNRYLGSFKERYREQGIVNPDNDWRKEHIWIEGMLKQLTETELSNYAEQMEAAYKASQDTFRTDVAIALSNNLDHLDKSMDRLNQVLSTCPVFSNGERYRFTRTVRPQLKGLLKFIKDIAAFGPNDDLLGGPGEMPEEFRQLLDDKIAPIAGELNPLDDYREFFEFDIVILREDSITKTSNIVGSLSKRLGTGSGGEHRAPLYVIAGAALASAYRLDNRNSGGIRLMLLDEAFNKMDPANTVATMRYLEQLGLQVFMASPGENLGTLTAFLHRYYDILRDVDNSSMDMQPHDVTEKTRELFRGDLAEFNEDLIEEELVAIRNARNHSGIEVVA